AHLPIAVACFTCGCSNVPSERELERLPGQVIIFYDRNEEGDRPGAKGALKAAEQLGDRAQIALVPMPADCQVTGWDVSNALDAGFTLQDFERAAAQATRPKSPPQSSNPLRQRLIWNDDLLDNAPDYTNFLVPDLLTEDELFLLAAGPRTGKSLFAMTLARAVAAGETFLGRPVTQGTVIYAKCEDGDGKVKEREKAQGWGRGLPVAWLNDFKLSEVSHLDALTEELDPRLIVLDTLSRVKDSSISESSAEMSQLLEPLQGLAQRRGCCILLVHHTGKVSAENAGQVDIFDTIRGSSAIRAVCRGSMVIAAGERDYRLVVENGWGKHDLKIILDANTLNWKLLGHWSPVVNASQQEQIVDALKKLGQASVEQLHEETGIPKKSLYEQLSRLQVTEDTQIKVVKEGTRRRYTYKLALFNTIQQLNSALNSENPDDTLDIGDSQQNSFFSKEQPDQGTDCDPTVTPKMRADQADQLSPYAPDKSVEYKAIEPDQSGITLFNTLFNTIQHPVKKGGMGGDPLFVKGDLSGITSVTPPLDQVGDLNHPSVAAGQLSSNDNSIVEPNSSQDPLSCPLAPGDKVEIRVGQFFGRHVFVKGLVAGTSGQIEVEHPDWFVDRQYERGQLRLLQRGGQD
ncbi:MAG: AAA family ATPase, partial [Cyanothece sp. SIO1E1]|nr:AAA family ATPase [Cyanothece sp. SIO1E1]